MAVGERIRFFRTLRGMTMKFLGLSVGFPEKSADVRLAQYESGQRCPKEDLTRALAEVLEVSPQAISVPDIDSYTGLLHTLFTLEDRYGLHVDTADGDVCLKVNLRHSADAAKLHQMLCSWQEQRAQYRSGAISKEHYDQWRYCYPKYDITQQWASVPSQELSDLITQALTSDSSH